MGTWKHRLTDIDEQSKTATCSNCGSIAIYRRSNGRWQCRVKRNEEKRAYAERRPKTYKYESKATPALPSHMSYKTDDGWIKVPIETRNQMIEDCGSICAICKTYTDKPNLDHCHRTGRIRGILCTRCNTALGKFRDNIELLQAAIEYLQN